ncbi:MULTISPECIES: hypothetical protein [unclassified Blastococcus]
MTTEDGDAPARTRRAGVRDREEAVVARLEMLATALDDEPAPEFRAATRDRLVAMAAVRTPEAPRPGLARRLLGVRAADGPPPRWRTRLTAGLAGAALAVSALGTLVALSADAQPGDLLYDLKRGTERTQLALAGDDRGLTLLEFASTRLDELAAAQDDPDLVVSTLAAMDAQTTEGAALLVGSAVESGQADPVDRLADWSEEQAAELAAIRPELPTATAGAAQASLDLLGAVQARVAAVQAALECAPVPATEGSDDLGPVPGICAGAPAVPSPPAGGAPATDPDTPTSDQGAPPATPPTPAAPQPGGGTAGDPGTGAGSGSGSGSSPGGGSGGASPSPGAGPALPTLPLPAPGGGLPTPSAPGQPGAGTATPAPPPLIDTPLPICVYPVIC